MTISTGLQVTVLSLSAYKNLIYSCFEMLRYKMKTLNIGLFYANNVNFTTFQVNLLYSTVKKSKT